MNASGRSSIPLPDLNLHLGGWPSYEQHFSPWDDAPLPPWAGPGRPGSDWLSPAQGDVPPILEPLPLPPA